MSGVTVVRVPSRVMTRLSRTRLRYVSRPAPCTSRVASSSSLAVERRITPSRCNVPASSTKPHGSVNSNSVRSMIVPRLRQLPGGMNTAPPSVGGGGGTNAAPTPPFDALVAFCRAPHLLDGHVVGAGVGRRPADLAWPRRYEVPTGDFLPLLVEHHDRAVLARFVDLAFLDLLAPLPHVHRVGDAALERDVVPLHSARDLLHHELPFWSTGFVFDDVVFAAQAGAFTERTGHLALKLDAEPC